MSLKLDKPRRQRPASLRNSSIPLPVSSPVSKEIKDVLEKKVEDLSRKLAEEQKISRQNKISVTKMQRELSRMQPKKESLSKELEHERMLRVQAENRLHEVTQESESCRSRLQALQEEFKKMEEMVQNMIQYKSKIDQLKQEKSSLSVTYENNLQKFGSHISDLERENMVLLNEVKKLEAQMSNKTTDGRDKSKLLLERLRMLEKENSSLVLENEQQRQQYEKCLDEIANQVVQALLAQKMLREECMKLQNRVHDLELQNRQLSILFHQRMKLTSDSVHQHSLKPDEVSEQNIFVQGSIESLQSIFSEQMSENIASMPQMSTPPPWLQERLSLSSDHFSGDRLSIISLPGSIQSAPDLNNSKSEQGELCCRTMIETEFPATPSSPKVKHINVFERKKETKRSSSTSSLVIPTRPSKVRTRSTSSLSRARGLSLSPQGMARSELSSGSPTLTQPNQGNLQLEQLGNQSDLSSQEKAGKESSQEKVTVTGTQTSVAGRTQNHSIPVASQVKPPVSKTPTTSPLSVTQSPSPTRKQVSQGHSTRQTSKLPLFSNQISQNKESTQTHRNSKGETGIRMGCQSPVSKTQSTITDTKLQQNRSPPASSRQSSNTSRIPAVAKSTQKSQKPNKTTLKGKGGLSRQNSGSLSKLATPGSTQVKHSGIKTTLKTDTKIPPPSAIKTSSASITCSVSNITVTPTVNTKAVINTNSRSATGSNVSAMKGKEVKSIQKSINVASMPPWRHEGPYANPRPETHFPRMGTTNLTHTSPKTESVSPKADIFHASVIQTVEEPKSSTPKSEHPRVKPESCINSVRDNESVGSQLSTLNKGQYFYDYSDEDSDWNRPVSKDFSIASSVSLDEMLDKTLENIGTSGDTDFSSDTHFIFKSPVLDNGALNDNNDIVSEMSTAGKTYKDGPVEVIDNDDRLRGKPDIVKDTEECEQRNMKKSLTISQIPGSGVAGYRARRPKSLILGSKDKKFVYAEYGSSSSLDSTSDEDWSYQFSYAKNIKQKEIQSKVTKSLQSGSAKEIGTATNTNISTLEVTLNTQNDKNNKNSKLSSQLPRPTASKKSEKTPPPIAQKPVRKRSPSSENIGERPRSIEICVNTVLAPAVAKPVITYFPFHERVELLNEKDINKFTPEKFSTLPQAKTENGEKKLDTSDSFDEVTVERSGSRDDGYSTMSSDVQPEAMEKFSDENIKENQSHFISEGDKSRTKDSGEKYKNEVSSDPDSAIETFVLNGDIKDDYASQNLSSPTSVSSVDRFSQYGSLGRVRAMKLKYEFEIQNQSPEREIKSMKSPPLTPPKSPKKIACQDKTDAKAPSKIPLARQSNDSLIPEPQLSRIPVSQTKQNTSVMTSAEPIVPSDGLPNQTYSNYATGTTKSQINYSNTGIKSNNTGSMDDKFSKLRIQEQFSQLSYFMPPSEPVSFLREGGYDSSSSTSEKGSDLTSLHISEDNILSDIPEEKEGYESSVGRLSEANSLASIPLKEHQTKHVHTCCQQKVHFEVRLRKYWTSMDGLMRAVLESDVNQQSSDFEASFYDDVYGGSLNMDKPLDRSASEADISLKRDNPEKQWLPRLSRSRHTVSVDELVVEGRVNDILKQIVFQQLSKTAESADSDDKSFSNFVEMLIQKGHVLDPSSSYPFMETSLQSRVSVSCSSVTSSKGHHSSEQLDQEDRLSRESSCGPVGEEQKQFNSHFYSLCNVGSNQSISENSEGKIDEVLYKIPKRTNGVKDLSHGCDKTDEECKKCLEEKNAKEFDEISKQIESLSKTVNELHRSLTSLNSENNDSEPESNEGDHSSLFNSAIGNKEIDGYQWLEDEFFLSPYGGEIILGSSPFSDTGASCDWMNDYMDNASHFDETFAEHEAMHDRNTDISPVELDKKSKQKYIKAEKSSILAGMMDDEGNFNSQEFISQRLKREELKLGAVVNSDGGNGVPLFDVCAVRERHGGRQVLKEDLHTTPEKDDDTSFTAFTKMTSSELRHSDLGGDNLNLSQDSLDDNIGVDQVMCHRFLGQGERKATPVGPGYRPALDFTSKFFTRYGEHEKEAVAAFDFLDDITTSVTSPDSNHLSSQEVERRMSCDADTAASAFPTKNEGKKHVFKNNDAGLHDQFSSVKVERAMLHSVRMDQSVSSTDSYMTPVKRNRRRLRAKIKKGEQGNCKRSLRQVTKFSSTSADESNDELSFSDSCCYHSFSSSSESLEDQV